MEDPNSFFSTLSADELHRLVIAPKEDFRAQDDVFRALGRPSAIASKYITNLNVSDFNRAFQIFTNSTLYLGLPTQMVVARSHLELCGKVFSRIVLRGMLNYPRMSTDRRHHFESLAALIAPFLLAEIELVVYLDDFDLQLVEIFTDRFGKSIKYVHLYAISAPFSLKFFNLPSTLKSFEFTGGHLDQLDPLWELVGDNLEIVLLSVEDEDDIGWKSCLGKLKTYCRKLSSIDLHYPLRDPAVEDSDITDLLCSYGNKLTYADLTGLGAESCYRIAKECINLRCHIYIDIDIPCASDGFSQLSALHNRLCSVDIDVGVLFRIDCSKLSYAMKSCGSIVEMNLRDRGDQNLTIIPHEFTRAIFPNPGRLLENLTVKLPLFFRSDSLVHIARCTGKLKTLKLNCLFPIHSTSFKSICTANSLLEDIFMRESYPTENEHADEEETREIITELVEATAPCKSLKHFRLQFYSRSRPQEVYLRDVQVPFRTRSVKFEATFMD